MPAKSGASSSSMNTAASLSSSWLDGSPTRQSPNRNGVRTPRGSIIKEPYDSPSRQIQVEFNLMLSRSDRDFNERLDQAAAERAKMHHEQLTKAAHEHQRVQEGAKLEIQRILLEQEHERQRREEAQRREIERLNHERARQEAEAQRQRLEAKRREEEAARQAAENQKQIQETEARLKAQKEQEEAARRQKIEKADADKKAMEVAAAAEKTRAQQAPQAIQLFSTPTISTSAAATHAAVASTAGPGIEELHAQYLELHMRMKKFRIDFFEKHRQRGDPLKEPVGDARRNVRKRLGQITVDRRDSVAAIAKLREECFNKALETPGPTIDIRHFIISHQIPALSNEAEAQYPAFLLYVWICFEKSVLKQFHKEASSEDGGVTQEIGLISASLLADQRYMWKGIPMTDIILAKLHRVCPILFGIRGTMATIEGRKRLGWLNPDSENDYGEAMTGYGSGYASLSLRQFSGKSPAIPMSDYWRAVVSICNTPSEALYPGHFMVLKGLLRDYVKKFLAFYGAPAMAVVRRATLDLPNRVSRDRNGVHDAAELVRVLPDIWRAKGQAFIN